MALSQGTRLGPYEILAPLGAGGMGAVYRAYDRRLGRDVAIKVLSVDASDNPGRLRRLEREARATGSLNHPNILAIYDVGAHEGSPFIVSELLDGQTLRACLDVQGPLTARHSIDLGLQMARGLAAAHDKKIVHRDLKPENLFLTTEGQLKILDFGLATREESDPDPDATTESWATDPGERLGTVGYMSPEQVRAERVDHRTDVFSFGVVLYEMLAGRRPFQRKTAAETHAAILRDDPPRPSERGHPVPPGLEAFVLRCLAKRPEERYQSARDLVFALEAVASGAEIHLSPLPSAPDASRRRPRLGRWASGAAVVLASVAAVVWLGGRGRSSGLPTWTPRQLTSDPGWEAEPALSPDGSLVAYVSDRSGNSDLWLLDAHGGAPVRLTDDPAADRSPNWFPDGSALAFVSDRSGRDAIWKVPRLGGSPSLLLPDAVGPAVSPDGRRIAFSRKNPTGYFRIAVAELSSPGQGTLLTGDHDGLFHHLSPAWSPDGRLLAYSDFRNLWLVSASGGRPRRLTDAHEADLRPAWSSDGGNIYFSSMRGGTLALWRVPAAGGAAGRVTLGTGPEVEPSLSRNGERLAYSTHASNPDIVLLDLRSGGRTSVGGLRTDCLPAIAPDRSRIVFSSDRDGAFDLWEQPLADGRPQGTPRRLTDQPGSENLATFSPDGRWIAYGTVLGEQRDIWVIASTGGLPQRFTDHPAVDMQPAWSPDGSRLAFVSNREGREHVFVAAIADGSPGGEARQVTFGEATDYLPTWSPDGVSLAFVRRIGSGAEVWQTPVDGSPRPLRLTRGAGARFLRWDRAGVGLLVSGTWGSEQMSLRRVLLPAGETLPFTPPVVMGEATDEGGEFDVSADGSLLAFVIGETRGDVWILEARGRAF